MTSISEFLSRLRQLRIRLWLDDDSLAFEAPTGALQPELRQQIRARKTEIMEYLRRAQGMVRADERPIVPVPRDVPQPLSFAQLRMWILDQLETGSAYTVLLSGRLSGQLDAAALQAAFHEIVRRHESLRTIFRETEDGPVQHIAEQPEFPFEVIDLSALEPEAREAEVERRATAAALQTFDLESGPLLVVDMLRLGNDEHVLLAGMHHIVADGWSMGVMFRELSTLYEVFSQGRPSPLPELQVQYADFSAWQRQRGDLFDRQLDYWRHKLAAAATLELPLDHPRPTQPSFRGERVETRVSDQLMRGLSDLGRSEDTTPFMTFMAAFSVLLARISGQDDIVVGTPIANRNRAEIEELIGFFVNSLAIRTSLVGNPSFRDVLRQVRLAAMEAFDNQDLPFEEVVRELEPERDLSRNPVFQVMFSMQNAPHEGIRFGDISVESLHADVHAARFDLDLHVWAGDDGLFVLSLLYPADLFENSTAERFLRQLLMLLEGAVADLDTPITEIPILSNDERERLVVEFNATATPYPREQTIHGLIEEQARKTPDAMAIAFESRQVSYRELDRRGDQLAQQLRRRGVAKGTLVALCIERSLEMVVGMLGVLKAGAAYVPLDPSHPGARLQMILEDAGVRFVITEPALVEALGLAHDAGGTARDLLYVDDGRAAPAAGTEDTGAVDVSAGDLAYVIFTSGSTGRPKGVQIEHRSVVNFLTSMQREPGVAADDVLLAVTTISFDIAGLEIFLPLIAGGKVVIAPRDVVADGLRLRDLLGAGITIMQATPATWQLLLHAGWSGTEGLKILCGGEALPPALAEELVRRGAELWNLYGPTETTIWSSVGRIRVGDEQVSIGHPIANTQLYVVDRKLCPVPPGVVGELVIGGDGLARGYLNRPALTGDKFVPDPFDPQGRRRLYRTGDLARFDANGRLSCLGRQDHQIKLHGYRIELGEIESALRSHAAIDDAVVTLWSPAESDARLAAYVVLRPEETSSEEEDQVERWETIWGDAYGGDFAGEDATFNTSGWISSYTGEPIPGTEMRDWLDGTVARILATGPSRVLEIGCGTGMILHRVSRSASSYLGTDISAVALEHIGQEIARTPADRTASVTLERRSAENFRGLPQRHFDTVILNSVVQYFPSIDYLLRVLDAAAAAIAPGGRLFLGDLRSLVLLDAYHASVEAFRASADTAAGVLYQRVLHQRAQQEELLLDPELCVALATRLPGARTVEVRPKRGAVHNELTAFRYDAIVGFSDEDPLEFEGPWLDWTADRLSLATVRDRLASDRPPIVGIRRIPNARTIFDAMLARSLADCDPDRALGDVRDSVAGAITRDPVDPHDLWALEEDLPYHVELSWLRTDDLGCFDALLVRDDVDPRPVFPLPRASARRWSGYANEPMQGKMSRALAPALEGHLAASLPGHMIPSTFTVLEALPLNPNGKIDRRALPDPSWQRGTRHTYVAPTTPTETQLGAIWAELLDQERVGATDDFFDLGGHSLLATQMLNRVRDSFGVELPLTVLFRARTLSEFAEQIDFVRLALHPTTAPGSDDLEEIEI